MKKLGQMAKGRGESKALKGVVIGEKYSRDEMPYILPSRKGKQAADTKKNGYMPPHDDKKKGTAAKALAKSNVTSSWATTKTVSTSTAPDKGSANLGVVLGLNASVMENPGVPKKLL